jgi:hypothetical protein
LGSQNQKRRKVLSGRIPIAALLVLRERAPDFIPKNLIPKTPEAQGIASSNMK